MTTTDQPTVNVHVSHVTPEACEINFCNDIAWVKFGADVGIWPSTGDPVSDLNALIDIGNKIARTVRHMLREQTMSRALDGTPDIGGDQCGDLQPGDETLPLARIWAPAPERQGPGGRTEDEVRHCANWTQTINPRGPYDHTRNADIIACRDLVRLWDAEIVPELADAS